MPETIGKGANTALRGGQLRISAVPSGIDLTVLCLRENGKVGSDADFVFYNQPVSPDSAVRLTAGEITSDLAAVTDDTHRMVVAASVDTATFGAIALSVRITEAGAGVYDLPITGSTAETTVLLAEVYRRAGGWKLRNIGQGYATGLAGLATDFGITVDDEPAPAPAIPMTPGTSTRPPAQRSHPTPPAPGQHVTAGAAQYPAAPAASVGGPAGFADAPGHPPARTGSADPGHPQSSPPGVNFGKGVITLGKDAGPVLLEKAPLVRLRVAWASGTDYEAYALVVLSDGKIVHVATFPAAGIPASPQYGDLVRHLGDRGRGDVQRGGGLTEEIIEVCLAPEIVAVVPVAYSAINNGTGSFRKYRVTLSIESGADSVSIPADQAKKSSWIFTCVPGIVYNRPEGVLIERLELYSRRFSEHRPAVALQPDGRVEVRMDKGPVNQFKADRT
ncbi:TerD family protein [Nocardia flavorosea]|uniref:TerD family protein n=1 Tax=Nocardia flavorosea TaxID=53429 RepID=UPI001894B8E1|nr:TerD family protein [Nocardia flavorosea]MBF6352202.1 TerD family protein [Nocardia flavorosea]